MRPDEGFAVYISFQKAFAHHQPQIAPRASPRRIGIFIDDVAQIIQPPGVPRLAVRHPGFARLPAFPGTGCEAQNFRFDIAPFQGARENIGAHGGHGDRASAHGARIIEQKGDDRVAEFRVGFHLIGKRLCGVCDDPRQTRRVKIAFFQIEIP